MADDRFSISPTTLFDKLGTPGAPVILDVRIDPDVIDDPYVVPTSRPCAHLNITSQATDLVHKDVVVYCKGGLKLSMGAAAILRTQNVRAQFLIGGQDGWRDAQLPLVSANAIAGSELIVLPDNPTPFELGAMWLIRRFVAPQTRVIFGGRDHVSAIAEKFQGVAIMGDTSFDDAATRFAITSPALLVLATSLTQNDIRFVPLCHAIATGYSDEAAKVAAAVSLFDTAFVYVRSTLA
jgi:rhodanese-related sulfurtransferase